MSMEAVDVRVRDRRGTPLVGVTVKILSQDGTLVYGQTVTDDAGVVSLLLPAPAVYQARFFSFGVSFQGAVLLNVQTGLNTFTAYGTPFVYPSSLDARICLASGFFRTPTGAAAPSVDMHFIPRFDPILLEGSPVLTERVIARTDAKGYVSVPLIRFGQYDVMLQGMDDIYRTISVPDSPSVNIGDLLFPVVKDISFGTDDALTVAVGATLTLTPIVTATDLRELPNLVSDLLWSVSDPNVLQFDVLFDTIVLKGLRAGTSQLQAVRRDQSIIRIPNLPITGVPRAVVVT